MTDSYSDSRQQGGPGEGGREGGRGARGGRGPGNREGGGFRIRLSDNEMRSARALQEALNLRSTVAVLGFAVRTLGQMLEDGKLDELVAQQRAQGNRGGGRRDDERGGRRGEASGREGGLAGRQGLAPLGQLRGGAHDLVAERRLQPHGFWGAPPDEGELAREELSWRSSFTSITK